MSNEARSTKSRNRTAVDNKAATQLVGLLVSAIASARGIHADKAVRALLRRAKDAKRLAGDKHADFFPLLHDLASGAIAAL